ncbi:MAG: hypothetical protein K2L97_02420, partial [Muribaculaceae bacterium]|nr:hypothetical protein [Muribaculaceae bacterium]
LPKESATFSSCRFNFFNPILIPNSRYYQQINPETEIEIKHLYRGLFIGCQGDTTNFFLREVARVTPR